jgi:methionyl-tRNA formyltransferase
MENIPMKKKTKIIFFGTSDFSVQILESLLEHKYDIAMAVTQPDRKVGRKQEVVCSPVKRIAETKNIRIIQPDKLRKNFIFRELKNINPDVFIVASYGNILPKELLEIPKFGSINLHASLLPKYRGASPIQGAILSGDSETGVTIMLMNEKMDEGDILAQEKIAIGKNDTTSSLMIKLGDLGGELIVKLLPKWIEGGIESQKQNSNEATYCGKVKCEDGQVDWSQPAEKIYRQWKALYPWPGIYTYLSEKRRYSKLKLNKIGIEKGVETGEKPGKVVEYNQKIGVQTGDGIVFFKNIQPEGKNAMVMDDFLRGHRDFLSTNLINIKK